MRSTFVLLTGQLAIVLQRFSVREYKIISTEKLDKLMKNYHEMERKVPLSLHQPAKPCGQLSPSRSTFVANPYLCLVLVFFVSILAMLARVLSPRAKMWLKSSSSCPALCLSWSVDPGS